MFPPTPVLSAILPVYRRGKSSVLDLRDLMDFVVRCRTAVRWYRFDHCQTHELLYYLEVSFWWCELWVSALDSIVRRACVTCGVARPPAHLSFGQAIQCSEVDGRSQQCSTVSSLLSADSQQPAVISIGLASSGRHDFPVNQSSNPN